MAIRENFDLRIKLGEANNLEDFYEVANGLKDNYLDYHKGNKIWDHTTESNTCNIILPPWLCQPYVRMPPEQHLQKVENQMKAAEDNIQVRIFFFTLYTFCVDGF